MIHQEDKLKLLFQHVQTMRGHLMAAHAFGKAALKVLRSPIDLGITAAEIKSTLGVLKKCLVRAKAFERKVSRVDDSTEFIPK